MNTSSFLEEITCIAGFILVSTHYQNVLWLPPQKSEALSIVVVHCY